MLQMVSTKTLASDGRGQTPEVRNPGSEPFLVAIESPADPIPDTIDVGVGASGN